MSVSVDVVVIGGGQSRLVVGFHLCRTPLSYVILDAHRVPGGAWLHTWDSMRLFSPARFSSLPGWVMGGGPAYHPTRGEALDYLRRYAARYALRVERPVRVTAVRREGEHLLGEAVRLERSAPETTTESTAGARAEAAAATGATEHFWRARRRRERHRDVGEAVYPGVRWTRRLFGVHSYIRHDIPRPRRSSAARSGGGGGSSGAQIQSEL